MKKLICVLLSLLMILPLAACSNSDNDVNSAVTSAAGDATANESSSGEPLPAVGKKDYQKSVFRMVGFNKPGSWYYAKELEQNTLNDAVYEMNQVVENQLNVQLEYDYISDVSKGGEIFEKVSPYIMTGDDAYQLCILHPYYSYNSFITQNYAFDFYNLESMDLSRSYWNKRVIDQLAINGHAYIALGALCSYTLNILYCNKGILKDAKRDVPYDLVRNQKWTLDQFFAITKDLYVDKNGNATHDNGDCYGFAGLWDANGSAFMQASDIYVVQRNEENVFEVALEKNDRLVNFYDSLLAWSLDESVYLWNFGDRNNESVILDFLNGRSAFTLAALGTDFLEATFDVGVLPLPKYSEAQENYRHVNWGNNIVVPSSIRNTEMVGDVLELMAYYTSTIVHNAYYDTVLQYKVSNSPDDRDMVMLIYNTVVYDPGIAFCDGNSSLWNLVYLPCFGILNKTKKVASTLRANVKNAQRKLNELFNIKDKT